MRKLAVGFALACAALVPAVAATKPAAAAHDWSKMASATPEGSFVLGDPKAKVRLVEYMSMTCSHCAHFAGEGLPPLIDKYVRKGLVALEVRHAIRDSLDVTATLLARCNGPKSYFPTASALLAAQDGWIQKAIAFQDADKGAIAKLPLADALAASAQGAGLDKLVAARGLAWPRAKACLASKAEQDRLSAMAKEAWRTRAIPGTPAFLINGTLVDGVASWEGLEPKLRQALR